MVTYRRMDDGQLGMKIESITLSDTDDAHTGVGVKNGKMWEFSQVGNTCSYHSFKEHNQLEN